MQIIDFLNHMCIAELNNVHTYIAAAGRYPMKNDGRRHHGLVYTVSGTETYHFGEHQIRAVPGSILYIPKGTVYRITLEGTESVAAVVDFESIGEGQEPFLIRFSELNTIRLCFSRLEAEWKRKDTPYLPVCKSLCYRITELMVRQQELYSNAQHSDRIAAGVEYLHGHCFEEDFRIEDAAEAAQISRRYFETLFRQKYGTTPNEYILLMKIERAKELLSSEKILIREIPPMLGYADIYHFGKLFTAKTGYTPSEYRKSFH